MNTRRLSHLALPVFLAAGACTSAPVSDPATTPTPAALRARLDRLVPPIVDRAADAATASGSSLGSIAHTVGLPTEAWSTQWRPVVLGSNAGARAAAWLDAVLGEDAFDGHAYHLDTGAVCSGDAACTEALDTADLSVIAKVVGDDGVELDVVRGADEAPVSTITLSPEGARLSLDLSAFAPIASAVFEADLARSGLSLTATGFIDAALSTSADTAHLGIRGPIKIVIRPTTAPADDAVSSLELGDASSVDVRLRGHGPVDVHTLLHDVVMHVPHGDDAPVTIDAQAIVQLSEAAITHLELGAP